MIVDIFLPAAFEVTAGIVAGLLQPADPLAGLVADDLAGARRFRAVGKRRRRRGESDGESRDRREGRSHRSLGLKRQEGTLKKSSRPA